MKKKNKSIEPSKLPSNTETSSNDTQENQQIDTKSELSQEGILKRFSNLITSENKLLNFALWTIAEVGFVVIGILLAFQIDSWNAAKEQKKKEIVYLQNLYSDLSGQIANVDAQIAHEKNTRNQCETACRIIQIKPYDIPKLLSKTSNLTRQTLVVSNSVFEDLKSSGNLSIISDLTIRRAIMEFYQFVDYVVIAITVNNTNFIDPFYHYLLTNCLVDYGYKQEIKLTNGIDFSATVKPFEGGLQIIQNKLNNDETRFSLFNYISSRARLSSAHLFLLERLQIKNKFLVDLLSKHLENIKF